MSEYALRSLITHALVDTQLCKKLLNGGRELVLAKFDLSDDELSALKAIRADSLQAFAAQIDDWLDKDEEPHPWPTLVREYMTSWADTGGEGSAD